MLKMPAFSIDTSRQTTPPLVYGVVHNRLVQFAPHGDQTLVQLVDVLDHAVVHTINARDLPVTVKCTLLRFMNHGKNVGFNFSR